MKARSSGGMVFDPALCPLLDGLSEDEKHERMQSDPIIRTCVNKLECGASQLDGCQVKRAYIARAARKTEAKAGVE